MPQAEILPQNTEDTLYIEDLGYTLNEVLNMCDEYWPDFSPVGVVISHEHHQVKCFGYDQYDPTDYKDYFVLTKVA